MSSRLLIDAGIGEIRAAHVRDNRLHALYIHHEESPSDLGNIYGARVIKAGSGQDLFLDLGNGQQAHMSVRRAKADGRKTLPTEGTLLPVQIIREAQGHKLAEATTRLRLAGRYVVLDKRISGGFLIRKDHDAKAAEQDMLAKAFDTLEHKNGLLYQAPQGLAQILMNCPEVDGIYISDPVLFTKAQKLCQSWPDLSSLLKRSFETQSLFAEHELDGDIEAMLSGHIPLSNGGWIDIAETEALCAIDVNSGDAPALDSNILAAKEIAHQLHLQNIGGLIVIDFIDMQEKGAWSKVLAAFDEAIKEDKARVSRTTPSQFGLIEVNREKSGPSLRQRFTRKPKTQPNTSFQAHALLRKAKTVGLQSQSGDILLEAPSDVLQWLGSHPDLLTQLAQLTQRPVKTKIALASHALLVKKENP